MNPMACRDLSKAFGGVQAVDRLNLEIAGRGAIYGLLGPNVRGGNHRYQNDDEYYPA